MGIEVVYITSSFTMGTMEMCSKELLSKHGKPSATS